MSTEKLRREIAELKARRAARGCPECGPITVRHVGLPPKPRADGTVPGNPPEPPEHCPTCGRKTKRFVIRMKGLADKSRGDGSL
jgi:rubrerythrin